MAKPSAASSLVTILFTDMEGSTTLTQRLGDAKAQEVLRTHNRIVRDALKAHSGSEIKHTGDGIMASFASASRALECAIAIQRTLAQHNVTAEEPIRVRIGLNAGEPVAEEKDLFGTAVQLAARICAHAEPGEILAPIVVRELAAGKGFLFSDRGDVVLRGFEDPVRLVVDLAPAPRLPAARQGAHFVVAEILDDQKLGVGARLDGAFYCHPGSTCCAASQTDR